MCGFPHEVVGEANRVNSLQMVPGKSVQNFRAVVITSLLTASNAKIGSKGHFPWGAWICSAHSSRAASEPHLGGGGDAV